MQGYDQTPVWCASPDQAPPLAAPVAQGVRRAPRDHVIVENRHQPTRLHLRTYVDERYKLTVYRDQPYGELFDLQDDPEERRNLWGAAEHGRPQGAPPTEGAAARDQPGADPHAPHRRGLGTRVAPALSRRARYAPRGRYPPPP